MVDWKRTKPPPLGTWYPEIRTERKVRPRAGFRLRKEDDTAVRNARISLEGESNDVIAGRRYGGCHVLG
jgi:hypothetical protein